MNPQELIVILEEMKDVKREIIGMQKTGDSVIDAHLEAQVMNSEENSEDSFQKKLRSDSDPNVRRYNELTRKLERDYLSRMSAEDLMGLYRTLVP